MGFASDPHVLQAVIAGLLTGGGIFSAGLVAVLAWLRIRRVEAELAELREAKRRGDLLAALWSEIGLVWMNIQTQGSYEVKKKAVAEAFAAARRAGDQGYTPYVTKLAVPLMGERISRDAELLDSEELQLVLSFYNQVLSLNQMIEEMQTDRFRTLSLNRKEKILHDMYRVENRLVLNAGAALKLLEQAGPVQGFTARIPPSFQFREALDAARAFA
ncbi:hypothetical protein [Mangrovicoccus sp. HB161399]|uniref:hypothetical protein n=1 Tax=Mangrovicoccus sp. HB161399 TaxID=2720392 RepID=UPI0015551C38|nr:hypothetical protein [Mangrovicoccus sp. HB161399]